MYDFFVGCDVSKATIDVSYRSTQIEYLGQFDNNISGFSEMVELLKTITEISSSRWFVCFENTGVYSKALLAWLYSMGIPCCEENAMKISKSKGVVRGRNDVLDSQVICKYAFEKRDSLTPTRLSKPLIVRIRKLLSRRKLLVKQKQGITVSLQDQQDYIDPDHLKIFQKQNQDLIKLYSQQIKFIEREIQVAIASDVEVKKNYDLATSVVGIGPVIGAHFIVITENFTTFLNGRNFASYSGIAPFLHGQSGTKSGKNRVSHIANKYMKALLSNAASAAKLYDPQIADYWNRMIEKGKPKGVVINNVKNKLVQRTFAVVKRRTPYVKLNTYA